MRDIIEVPEWTDTRQAHQAQQERSVRVRAHNAQRRRLEAQAQRNYKLRCWLALPTLAAFLLVCSQLISEQPNQPLAAAGVMAMLPWLILYIGRPPIDY